MSQVAQFGAANNPYRSATAGTADSLDELALEDQIYALQAFVGPRANFYLRKWIHRLEDPNGDTGWNWAAFFLCGLWLGYRKMYMAVVMLLAASVFVAIAQQIFFVVVLGLKDLPTGVNLIVNVVTCVVCGAGGNGWYLNHAKRQIAKCRAQGFQDEQLRIALAQRGGTSLFSAFTMFFLTMALVFLIVLIVVTTAVVAVGVR